MYPSNQFDNVSTLMPIIGSFWSDTYGGFKFNIDYLRGACLQEQQNINDLQECQDTIGRITCPVAHVDDWYKLVLCQDDTEADNVFPLPKDVLDIPALTDAILFPNTVLTRDIDYTVDPVAHKITFAVNPFNNPNLNPQSRQLTLWGMKVQRDRQYVFNHIGSVAGISGPSTQTYKNLANAYLDAISSATAWIDVINLISAMADIAVTRVNGEVVEEIFTDTSNLVIVTDQNVYKFVPTATAAVAIGDELMAGDPLTTGIVIHQPNRGEIPTWLTSLSIPANFFLDNLTGPLVWNNANTPLIVTENVSGFTKVEWALGGAPADITQFFNDLHARGVANGNTLANYMDMRPQPQPTQPSALALPKTINPLQFLMQNVLRANTLIVKLDVTQFGPQAMGLNFVGSLLRNVTPPQGTVIVLS